MSTHFSLFLALIALIFHPLIWADAQDDLLKAVKNGEYETAAIIGNGILQKRPENPEIRFLTALALQKSNQLDAAEQHYLTLIEQHPDLPEPHNNLAIIYLNRGDHDNAATHLIASLKTHPAYATAWQNLSDLYKGLASEAYRKALSEETSGSTALQQIRLAELDQLHLTVKQVIIPVTVPVNTLQEHPPMGSGPITLASNDRDNESSTDDQSQTSVTPAATSQTVLETPPTNSPQPIAVEQTSASSQAEEADMESVFTPVMALNRWAEAWSAQDTEAYINAYDDQYKGRLKSRDAWIKQRRSRLSKPEFIRVELNNIELKQPSDDRAILDFEQSFTSNSYQDKVVKRIDMTKIEGNWKINRERTIKVLQKNR